MPPTIKSPKSFQDSKQPHIHPSPCRYNTNLYRTNTLHSTNLPKSLMPSQLYIPSKDLVDDLLQSSNIFQSHSIIQNKVAIPHTILAVLPCDLNQLHSSDKNAKVIPSNNQLHSSDINAKVIPLLSITRYTTNSVRRPSKVFQITLFLGDYLLPSHFGWQLDFHQVLRDPSVSVIKIWFGFNSHSFRNRVNSQSFTWIQLLLSHPKQVYNREVISLPKTTPFHLQVTKSSYDDLTSPTTEYLNYRHTTRWPADDNIPLLNRFASPPSFDGLCCVLEAIRLHHGKIT